MKKVLFVTRPLCPPWDEASKNFAYHLAKNLPGEREIFLFSDGSLSDLPANVGQLTVYDGPDFDFRAKWRCLRAQKAARGKYDIHHYFFTPTPLNALLSRLFLSPRTTTVQTVAALREDLYSAAELRWSLFADKLITYTKKTAECLRKLGKYNVRQIYPGIDTNKFSPAPKDKKLLKYFDIPADAPVISYAGEYSRLGSSVDMVIEAMEELWSRPDDPFLKNAILLLAVRVKNSADARKKEQIVSYLKSTGTFSRVRFSDTFGDMAGIYNLSDYIWFPPTDMSGKFEVPLALIEAYACGKPVFVSDIPALSEFTDPSFSVIIKNGSALDLAEKTVLLSREGTDRIARAAREFALENFDIRKIAQKYEEIYRSLPTKSD